MANSKANIYPIQLQGAQLNLNKYDAEIKQYSGFNKNNAPYVGGCLANVFTKDETQEGSTSENTYIDTNGDVYHVDTSGLWKNGEKLESYSYANFYKIKKIEKKDVLINYSDKIALTCINDKYYINGVQVASWSYNTQWSILEYAQRLIRVVFDTINTLHYCMVFYNYTIYIFNADTGEFITKKQSSSYSGGYIPTGDYDLIPKILKNAGSEKFIIIGSGVSGTSSYRIYYFKGSFDGSTLTISQRYTAYEDSYALSFFDTDTNNVGVFSSYVWDYLFEGTTNKMISRFCKNQTSYNSYIYEFNLDVDFVYSNITTSIFPVKYAWGVKTRSDSLGTNVINDTENNRFLKKVYTENNNTSDCYHNEFQYESDGNSSLGQDVIICINSRCPTLEDFESQSRARFKLGSIYSITDDYKALFNNGFFSGLSTANGTLLTNWNSVDVNTLTFDKSIYAVCFKDGNDWYQIERGSPALKKVGAQIITNSDKNSNCYFLEKALVGNYGLAFNCYLYIESSLYRNAFSKTQKNNYYCAAAINEYALEDNCSLLLNPISVYFPGSLENFSSALQCAILKKNIEINIYTGESDVEYAKTYVISVNSNTQTIYTTVNKKINQNLVGLPFPSNSDGNVQYSPSLFSEIKSVYGNEMFIKNGNTFYPLMKGNNNEPVMSFFLASGLDNLEEGFIVQGQFYGIINNGLYSIQYSNGVLSDVAFVVDTTGLKFCGNTPYQAFFFSKTNRCLYSFTGANVMNQAQFLDKFEDVIGYKYNPATQTIFMITANEVIAYSSFGTYEIYFPNCTEIYLLENGACLTDDEGNYRYIKYYAENGYTKQNITLDTCFYGMNNQTVTINDCLYVRLFSEEHESGNVEISASTLSNSGRMTEKTTFKIKSTDWDKMTNTVYLRYQPKEQRGLGVSFSINSPFKIAALSVGSQPDAILIDKVSKNAINAPQRTTNNNEW